MVPRPPIVPLLEVIRGVRGGGGVRRPDYMVLQELSSRLPEYAGRLLLPSLSIVMKAAMAGRFMTGGFVTGILL